MAATTVEKKQMNRVLGGCELIGPVGRGAMGTVFKARQLSFDRTVAVKILSTALAKDRTFVERFQREARAAAKLSHPNVIQAIDVGESQGYHYFVMEYIDGTTVASLIEQHGMLPEGFCLDVAAQVARAIQAAERLQMVHRDIKPGNIMLTRDRIAKLADFGLAMRAVEAEVGGNPREVFGTPEYVSPEQALGNEGLDSRSDIYSLGVSLYHMLTGQFPFKGRSPREVVDARFLTDALPLQQLRASLSVETCTIVGKMMARDRNERYRNAAELLEDLEFVIARRGAAPAAQPQGSKGDFSTEEVYAVTSGSAPSFFHGRKSRLAPVMAVILMAAIGIATFVAVRSGGVRETILRKLHIAGVSIPTDEKGAIAD